MNERAVAGKASAILQITSFPVIVLYYRFYFIIDYAFDHYSVFRISTVLLRKYRDHYIVQLRRYHDYYINTLSNVQISLYLKKHWFGQLKYNCGPTTDI